ncbi:hypothetical protein ACLMJK_005548 [Lecanora helva]
MSEQLHPILDVTLLPCYRTLRSSTDSPRLAAGTYTRDIVRSVINDPNLCDLLFALDWAAQCILYPESVPVFRQNAEYQRLLLLIEPCRRSIGTMIDALGGNQEYTDDFVEYFGRSLAENVPDLRERWEEIRRRGDEILEEISRMETEVLEELRRMEAEEFWRVNVASEDAVVEMRKGRKVLGEKSPNMVSRRPPVGYNHMRD